MDGRSKISTAQAHQWETSVESAPPIPGVLLASWLASR